MQQSRRVILAAGIAAAGIVSIALILYALNFFSLSPAQSPSQSPNLVIDDSILRSENETELTEKKMVTISLILSDERLWDALLEGTERDLEKIHPDIEIEVNPIVLPYDEMRTQTALAISNQSAIDIISLDQIWLGEYVEKGFLSDLTARSESWGRSSEWYQANWDGGVYEDRVYAIWAWTDIRGIWYWKDMLDQADVDPDSLKTWDGYIASAKKLDAVLGSHGIQGVHLVGAEHSSDMWYPYLWMLGGDILEQRQGHPTKGAYWYPSYNDTEGVRALEFLKAQVEAGIEPQRTHEWGVEFVDRKFAVMVEGSWMPGEFENVKFEEEKVGFLPMFPVPDEGTESATLMGGWMFGIPETSKNKDLAWEFLTNILEPQYIVEFVKDGYLPTQVPVGEGPHSEDLREAIPYYDSMVSMLAIGHKRPNIPEYPQIAGHIKEAIDSVYAGEDVQQALDEAARKSADVLGWNT